MEKRASMPVPVCATVSRKTGEIRFEYSDSYMDQVRFGRIMNRISRIQEVFEDERAREDAFRGAATTRL